MTTLASAFELPVPPPPGLVVIATDDPRRAAAMVVRAVNADRSLTVGEARQELDRRRDERLVEARERLARRGQRAAAALDRSSAARTDLPPVATSVSPAELRRAAAAVDDATVAVATTREALGPRPYVDEEAARAAREAQADVEGARDEWDGLRPRANWVLTRANAAAGLIVAGRLVTEAFDPAFFLVGVLPLAGLGYAGTIVGRSVRRRRAAAHRRWVALRSLDVCTMAALDAREERARAWDVRAVRLAQAEAELARARATWRALVGPTVAVSEAPRVAAEIEQAAALAAQADAAWRSWAEAADQLQAAEDGAGAGDPPLVVLDPDRAPDLARRQRLMQDLAARAGRSPVVLVLAGAAAKVPVVEASPHPDAEVDAAPIVDLRDRVVAGLHRLRSRQTARRRTAPPGSAVSS